MADSYTPGWELDIDGYCKRITTIEELRSALQPIMQDAYSDIALCWAKQCIAEPYYAVLKNRDRAFVMYIPSDGDAGFTARSPDYQGPLDAWLNFLQSNGQWNSFRVVMTIPFSQALEGMEYFFEHKDKPPFITWHDDSEPEVE